MANTGTRVDPSVNTTDTAVALIAYARRYGRREGVANCSALLSGHQKMHNEHVEVADEADGRHKADSHVGEDQIVVDVLVFGTRVALELVCRLCFPRLLFNSLGVFMNAIGAAKPIDHERVGSEEQRGGKDGRDERVAHPPLLNVKMCRNVKIKR